MALSTQLRPAPYHIPPPRINSMSTPFPSAHFGYTGSTGSAPNFPMFASNLHNSSRTITTPTPSSGLSSSISPYLSMCPQLPESPVPLSGDLQTPTENCDPPNSPLAPNSPDVVNDQESSSYNHLKPCAYNNSSVCSFSETPYTSTSIATTNGYSAVQNSMLNPAPPLSTMSSTIYPQSMFATPMYSSTVDYSSSFTNGTASNVWNPYPALPTMAGPLPVASNSNAMSNYKLSYDSPRYKLTPERAIPLVKWFEEHKEHPYPTRHEKILLCQSTQLTFTQVSTWFANARRRMKKANSVEEESRSNTDDSGSQTSAESSPNNTYEEMLSTA